MNPTPLGEGKTTVSIAIADGLNKIHKKANVMSLSLYLKYFLKPLYLLSFGFLQK